MIPGLERAEFARLGGLHRNSFLNSPRLLDRQLRLKARPALRFAGQITGVEGYVESAAIGLIAGRLAAAERRGRPLQAPPETTALGALVRHITGGHILDAPGTARAGSFQPMNINYGLLPPIEATARAPDGKKLGKLERTRARKRAIAERALADVATWAAWAAPARAELVPGP
jgi:methylenetetrahydrofolate--tRNA-(uracil-5-)-methyltransferase